jgi:NitT/TauT family transport system permease protein
MRTLLDMNFEPFLHMSASDIDRGESGLPANRQDAPEAGRRERRSWLQRNLTPKAAIPAATRLTAGLLVWVLILASWAALSYGHVAPSIFLPTPSAVIERAAAMLGDGSLAAATWASALVVLVGFAASSAIAVPLGLLMGSFKLVQAALDPLVNFIRYLPVTSFVPLFILWIGIGFEERVAIIIFGTFFQQLVMIADVVREVPADLVNASYTLGATRRDVLVHVLAPAARPGILDTLRITMGWAWTYLVVAELVAAPAGLGHMSMEAMRGFQVDKIFLAIGVIGLLGMVTDQGFRLLRRRFAGWSE